MTETLDHDTRETLLTLKDACDIFFGGKVT